MLDQGRVLLNEGEWVAAASDRARRDVIDAHRALAAPLVTKRLAGRPGREADAGRVADSVQVPIERGASATPLVVAVHRLASLLPVVRPLRGLTSQVVPALKADLPAAEAVTSRSGLLFGGREHKDAATAAYWRVDQAAAWASERGVHDRVRAVHDIADEPTDEREAWASFDADPEAFYALLADTVGMRLDRAGVEGVLPPATLDAVDAIELDTTHLSTGLREYQAFGTRFLLATPRAILADETGLGRRLQVLAALAHLRAEGANRFLVVCPASRVAGWERAIRQHTRLDAFRLAGEDAELAVRSWLVRGGVGIASYQTATVDLLADVDLEALVIDDAHTLKSPASTKAILAAALGRRADRVWYLTGVPLHSRPEDLAGLLGSLEAEEDADPDGVYLRREASDVNVELPPLVQLDEWCGLSGADAKAYAEAVQLGNFSSMRRAAFASADPAQSAKIERLLEIVAEARANGRRVLILSSFLSVLGAVSTALNASGRGVSAAGPLTSSMPPPDRQPLVDQLDLPGGADVLLAHLQEEGLQVTIPGNPVVVLCEPQVMPAQELQAIGRCRRRQRRETVVVHRLLTERAVDERMLGILDHERMLVDGFANDSTEAPVAGVSEVVVAQQIIPAERERLSQD